MAGRPKTPILSERIIVNAALRNASKTGDVQMVAIARDLGVAVSSLYNHVGDRGRLVELLRERIMEDVGAAPEPDGDDWESILRAVMIQLRDTFGRYPKLTPLLFAKAVESPEGLVVYERLAVSLTEAGLPADQVVSVLSVVDSFAIGAAIDVTVPDPLWLLPPEGDDDPVPALRAALRADGGHGRADRAFDVGLDVLVAGIRTRLPEQRSSRG